MDYSILFIGVFAGLIFGTIFISAGYCIGRINDGTDKGHNPRELRNDDSDDALFFRWSGSRSSDNRCAISHTQEEIAFALRMILHTHECNLSEHEKECMKEAIDRFECRSDGKKHTFEEKIMVLNTLRVGAGWFERDILNELSDDLVELDAIKFLREHEDEGDEKSIQEG